MATTINQYSVGLTLDAKEYIDASKISATETRKLTADINAARDPMDRFSMAQERIAKAYEAGAISAKVANKLLDASAEKYGLNAVVTAELAESEKEKARAMQRGESITKQYLSTEERFKDTQRELNHLLDIGAIDQKTYARAIADTRPPMEKHISLLDKLSKIGNVVTGAYHAFRSAIAAAMVPVRMVERMADAFGDVAKRLDDVADKAHKLGVTFNDLGGLGFAAGRLGGADAAAALDRGLGELLKRGMTNPGESAVDAFKRIADQITLAATQADKAKIATEAFGKSGIQLLAVLQEGSDEIGALVDKWDRFGSLTEAQIEGVGQFNDAWEDIKISLDGIAGRLVADIAPALTLVARDIQIFLEAVGTSSDGIRTLADDLIVASVMSFELAETFTRMATAVPLIASGQISAAGDILAGIEDPVTKARDALSRVQQERNRLQDEANGKETAHVHTMQDAHVALYEEWKKQEKLKEEAEKREVKHVHQMQDAHEELFRKWNDEQNKLGEKALDNARKHFEAERQRQMGLRAGVAAGPGSGMEAGSSEAARYLADQVNRAIGAAAVPDMPSPGEEELIAEARRQLELMEAEAKKSDEQIALLRKIADKPVELARAR